MNTLRKILLSITAVALLFLTSCLDDEDLGTQVPDFAGSPYVVDFNEMPNSSGYVKRSLELSSDPAAAFPAQFRVNLSSPWQLEQDLTVTVELDEAAVNEYIADNPDAGFDLLDAARHGFTKVDVVIPAGEREVEFTVNFKTAGIQIADKFMTAFSITATSNPNVILSGNFGTQYVFVGVKNKFHGTYAVGGQWWYHGTDDFSGYIPAETTLRTTSATGLVTQYSYAGWGDVEFEVSETAQTIDGHADAYYVTITKNDDPAEFVQLDDYDGGPGGVFNYCYKDSEGNWEFKVAYQYYSNVSWHIYNQLY